MNELILTYLLVAGVTAGANGCVGIWFAPPPTARNIGICIGLGVLGPVGFALFVLYAWRNRFEVTHNAK